MQRIEACHAGHKVGARYPIEHTRLFDQDDAHCQCPHDCEDEHSGFFGSVAQVKWRDDGAVETPEKETIQCAVQQVLPARLQFRIELHHQENQNERQPHRNQRRHQDQQQFLDHVILFARRQGEQIEETVIFLVIENRRGRGRDEKESHEYENDRNRFDCVGVERGNHHKHQERFQLFLQQQQVFYLESSHSRSPSIIISII